MKKKLRIGVITLALCALATSCSDDGPRQENNVPEFNPIELPANTRSVVESENDFAFDYLNTCEWSRFGEPVNFDVENYTVSPFSMFNFLGMLACGNDQDGETQKEIFKTLGLGAADMESFKEYCKLLNNKLTSLDPSTSIYVANAICGNSEYTFRPSFVTMFSEYFGGDCLYYTGENDAKEVVNKWIADRTSGLMEPIDKVFYASCDFYNILYFNGRWETPFNSSFTSKDAFHNADGEISFASYMKDTRSMEYMETDKLIGVELPFGSSNFSFMIFRSANSDNVPEMNGNDYMDLLNSSRREYISLSLPKFEVCPVYVFSRKLEFPVKEALFFSDFGDDSYRNDHPELGERRLITSYVSFQIDEDGVKATARTGTETTISPGVAKKVKFDSPFIYLVRERSTNTILFIGRQNRF